MKLAENRNISARVYVEVMYFRDSVRVRMKTTGNLKIISVYIVYNLMSSHSIKFSKAFRTIVVGHI